ncbi:MAG: transporter substrate-binding domain-containing protein [bacterium]
MLRYAGLLMMVLLVAGCDRQSGTGPQKTNPAKKIVQAAVCPTSPPNCFQRENAYVGIDVEILDAFCKARDYTFKMMAYDWSGMLGAVIANRADIAFSGISITEKRKEAMDFSDAYMVNVLIIAAIADRNVTIRTTQDWKTYRLGFVRGMYFGDLIKTTYKEAYDYADLRQYPSYNELLADLGNGKMDGAFMDSLVMADQKAKGIYKLITAFTLKESDQFGFAFPKGSPLRDEFNQYLRENAGMVKEIIARHMK